MLGIETRPAQTLVRPVSTGLTAADRWDHLLARCGIRRSGHRVTPGLYSVGDPTPDSPVLVTANYTISFDALRSSLEGIDAYILVVNTYGVNVWCAAGKGTFGTGPVAAAVRETGLRDLVRHRTLVLPQLSAPGVAAHEVRKLCGFQVEFGPVRAADLPEYLKTRQGTPQMRLVRFDLRDRAVLIPVELVRVSLPTLIAAVVFYFAGGLLSSMAVLAAVLAGVVVFPLVLPWLPTRECSTKGFILGAAVAVPFVLLASPSGGAAPLWRQMAGTLTFVLAMPPVTAFIALNFTGSTTFTSKSGVRREIYRYVPLMALLFFLGIGLTIALSLVRVLGGT